MKDESSQVSRMGPATAPGPGAFRERMWRIIFLSDTPAGRAFDVVLLWCISLSVLVVVLESVESLRVGREGLFRGVEWFFTAVFAVEYGVRLWVVRAPWRYARSFFGVVDLIAFLPSCLDLILSGSHYLMVLRVVRMLRMFRVLKMAQHIGEAGILMNALQASRAKISVFLFSVMTLIFVEGMMMYLLEHHANPGFNNIPQSMYWAVVTLTTVGYGDVSPVTVPGKMMASVIMLTGFAILAVPTGVVTAELGREMARHRAGTRSCRECGWNVHDPRARFCQQCGVQLGSEGE
jgi:voltage-gated potassium channel